MNPPIRVAHPHVVLDVDGTPRVAGGRLPVYRLWAWHRGGTTIATLIKLFPTLAPAKVLDAISFAYDNPELMDAERARVDAQLDAAHAAEA